MMMTGRGTKKKEVVLKEVVQKRIRKKWKWKDETRLADCMCLHGWCSMEKVVEWKAQRKRGEARLCLVCVACLHSWSYECVLFSSIPDDVGMANLDVGYNLCQRRNHAWAPFTGGSFHVKSTQVTTRPPQNWMTFCEIVVPMEISIPAKFSCFMNTRFLRADIQRCQKLVFWAQVVLEKVA
jgi:hypothetical protein